MSKGGRNGTRDSRQLSKTKRVTAIRVAVQEHSQVGVELVWRGRRLPTLRQCGLKHLLLNESHLVIKGGCYWQFWFWVLWSRGRGEHLPTVFVATVGPSYPSVNYHRRQMAF